MRTSAAAIGLSMTPEPQFPPGKIRENECAVFQLADGRALAYMEWGRRDGFPVFYFHGTPSSRLEGAFADQAAARCGFRLIAIDRPGFGRSAFQKKRRFKDWPGDVCALADGLGVKEFGVAGHSGAGPHLFACGVFVEAARLKFIGGLGPWGPVATPAIRSSMNSLDRFFTGVARRAPWVMGAAFAPLGWAATYWPGLFFRIMKSAVSPADRERMRDGDVMRIFRAMQCEAFRQGARGGAYEAYLAFTDWGFDIADVRTPTHIWVGDEDIWISQEMGRYLERTIPHVDFHWAKGKGHFNIENWDDIFAACKTHL